jgi:hypothetical protein
VCHYRRGYFKHLKLNVEQVFVWLLFDETEADLDFESEVNASWSFVGNKLFRWQAGAKNKSLS